MVLVAIRQQDWLVHVHPNGALIAAHMGQAMEHWIKHLKTNLRRNCNHKPGWLKHLMQFFDCLCIGCIRYDLIDFHKCQLEYLKHAESMYDETTTPMLEGFLISTMPPKWIEFHKEIHAIEFGGKIPQHLANEWNAHLRENSEIANMDVYNDNIDMFDTMPDYSSWDDEEDGDLQENIISTNKLRKKQILERMQNYTQSQYQ